MNVFLLLALLTAPCEATAPRNFGQVSAEDGTFAGVYRGAQPHHCGEIAYLRQLGVKTIVQLNDAGSEADRREKDEAEAAGIRVEAFDISPFAIGKKSSCADVDRILEILSDENNRPAYVHCKLGRDRTGYIIGAFEEAVLHKSITEVLAELSSYGYHGYPTVLFRQIQRELRAGVPTCTADHAFR